MTTSLPKLLHEKPFGAQNGEVFKDLIQTIHYKILNDFQSHKN
jgi:hypothetical protein